MDINAERIDRPFHILRSDFRYNLNAFSEYRATVLAGVFLILCVVFVFSWWRQVGVRRCLVFAFLLGLFTIGCYLL